MTLADRAGLTRESIPVAYPTTLTDREWTRFLELVEIPEDFETACWMWRGNRNDNGYGRFRFYDPARPRACVYRYAHRLMYALVTMRPVPLDMELDHACQTRACVSPYHLRLEPWAKNVAYANGTALRDEPPPVDWTPLPGTTPLPEIPF